MELKEYWRIVREGKKMIVAFTILTAVSAFGFSVYAPKVYEASVSLFLSKSGTQETGDFKYDGYYALQSGEMIADSIEKMLQSPEVVETIYRESGVDPVFKNIKSYKKKFTAHKMSSQYVEVGFSARSREDAQKITDALRQIVGQKIERQKDSSGQEVSFAIDSADPIILEKKANVPLNTAVGFLSGALLGTLAVFVKKYLA